MPRRPSKCHPDRVNHAFGKCRRCYDASQRPLQRGQMRAWRMANPARHAQMLADYAARNPDKIRAHKTKWRRANPEKQREAIRRWCEANPGRVAQYAQQRRARVQAAGGVPPSAAYLAALTAPGVRCFWCGVRPATTVDHVVPLARGGEHSAENLVGACGSCNSSKGSKMPYVEWLCPR